MGFDLGLMGFVAVLALVMVIITRFVFGGPLRRRGSERRRRENLGMLVPVVTSASKSGATYAKDVLSEHGIRSSMSMVDRDRFDVLVFQPDLQRAADALTGS